MVLIGGGVDDVDRVRLEQRGNKLYLLSEEEQFLKVRQEARTQ